MNGLLMLLKQLAPSLDIPGLLAQFETLKIELPKFARGVKDTVDKTDTRLANMEAKIETLVDFHKLLYDTLLQFIATGNHAPDVYPAGPSRTPEDFPHPVVTSVGKIPDEERYSDGAAV